MAANRIDWDAAASSGARVGRCILVAGLPWAIVPAGQEVTAVTWTGDADGAWHVGGSPVCRSWLLMRSAHDTGVPSLAWDERASPVQGTVDVGSLRFWLASADDAPTLTLGARDAQAFTRLAGDHSATATTFTVESTDAFASSGAFHVGRERVTYSGKTATTLTGCTRGTAGTRARRYVASGASHRVYAAGADERLPALTGRRCTVWLYRLSAAGVATDPTLVYDGRVAAGAGVVDTSAWEVVVEHAVRALDTEGEAPTLSLYGYSHGNLRRSSAVVVESLPLYCPLLVRWAYASNTRELTLTRDAADPDNGGWSESRERYLERFNRASVAGSFGVTATLGARGNLRVDASDGTNDRRLTTHHGWLEAETYDPPDPGDTRATATTYAPPGIGMPRACLWMANEMPLPPSERSKVPATPTYPLSDSTVAFWTLTAKCTGGEMTAAIQDPADPAADPILSGFGVKVTGVTEVPEEDVPVSPWLITQPTTARVGLYVRGARWWSALRYGVLDQVDGLRGTDQLSDSLAWDRIGDVAATLDAHSTRRTYVVDIEAPFLDLLRNECRLNGLALATWHGRVSVCRIRETAVTEPRAASLTSGHLRRGEAATLRECTDGLATAYRLSLPAPSEDAITVVDAGAVAESGMGDTIDAAAPLGMLPPGTDVATPALHDAVIAVASALLAPWVRPYQVAAWPGDLRLAGLQIGDVVELDEWLLPDGQGGRGLSGKVGTVLGVRRDFDAGTVDLELRLSASAVAGYAPACLVSGISGATVTVDTVTLGAAGMADATNADGSPRTDGGASFFSPGSSVLLVEVDSESPTAPYAATVSSVSGATVTLSGSPGATWEGLAATAGKVMLVPDDWTTSTTDQRRYAYVARASDGQLPSSTPGRRWT